MEEELLIQDRNKIADFLNRADSGEVTSGLNSKQREKVNQYVVDQRNKYVNAAFAAGSGRFKKNAPGYIEAVEEMNRVKSNLANLANQQKQLSKNQEQYLDDFQSDRISKSNYNPLNPSMLTDIYTGSAELSVDDFGNLMFGKEGKFQKYSDVASYSLKDTESANKIINIADRVAASRYKMPDTSLKLYSNRIKTMIDKTGRNGLMSLIKDDLLPGFGDIQIPKEFYKRENYAELKNYFLETMDNALTDINNNLPTNPKFNKNTNLPNAQNTESYKVGGKTKEDRLKILNAANELLSTGKAQGSNEYKFTFKGSNDANSSGYRLTTDGDKLLFRKDEGGSSFLPISLEDLKNELGFASDPTAGMTAAQKIEYYKNNKES